MTFEEMLQEYEAGLFTGMELAGRAMHGLTLANVHQRMGVTGVSQNLRFIEGWNRVRHQQGPRTGGWCRSALVFRTWRRPPMGGWLLAERAWRRLLALEASLDGGPIEHLDADRSDPNMAIRLWAVVARDAQGDVDGLAVDLDDTAPDVRLVAAAALVARGRLDDRVRDVLVGLLDDEDCSREAVAVLGPLRDPAVIPSLLALYQRTDRSDVLRYLSSIEALPILKMALLEGDGHYALEAIREIGPAAAVLWRSVLDALKDDLADAPTPYGRWRVLFDALVCFGSAAEAAGPVLMGWAEGCGVTDDIAWSAVRAAGAVSADARATLAGWLPSGSTLLRRRALTGLGAGGETSRPWGDHIQPLLDDTDPIIAVDAANALACIGETRTARDAWLRFEAWPLDHHLSYPGLHRLANRLIADLPAATDRSDPEDIARSVRALETAGIRQRNSRSSAAVFLPDDVAAAHAAAGVALAELREMMS